MLIVPLQATPNQTLIVSLANQLCQINVYQKSEAMFFDLLLDNAPVVMGVVCENLNRMVRSLYLGFQGDFAFIDNQGSSDPVYTGFGPTTDARYNLAYIEAGELLPVES